MYDLLERNDGTYFKFKEGENPDDTEFEEECVTEQIREAAKDIVRLGKEKFFEILDQPEKD